MKIGILTLPLHVNYGGVLQAHSLMVALQRMGHETWLIDRSRDRIGPARFLFMIGRGGLSCIAGNRADSALADIASRFDSCKKRKRTKKFIENNIRPVTKKFRTSRSLEKHIDSYKFDAIIVGSDQVWRATYAPNVTDYFLGFYSGGAARVAYAASFGTDGWTGSPEALSVCRNLLQRFHAISVREDSGVGICRALFNREAEHVLDPTMLLPAEYYRTLANAVYAGRASLAVYYVDENSEKLDLVRCISDRLKLVPVAANMPPPDIPGQIPDVAYWLKTFCECSFAVVDSFHGCVFAILLHKPFLVVANEGRGTARFLSLLRQFGLEDRLVTGKCIDFGLVDKVIDWEFIDDILNRERQKSFDFITRALALS